MKIVRVQIKRGDVTGNYAIHDERDALMSFYLDDNWHRLTGIRLRKGQVVQAEIRQTKTGFSVRVKK